MGNWNDFASRVVDDSLQQNTVSSTSLPALFKDWTVEYNGYFFCYFSLIFAIFGCRGKISFFPKKNICPLHEKYYGLELHLSFFCRQLLDDVVELCINAGPSTSSLHCVKVSKSSIEAVSCEALSSHLWPALSKTMHW